MTKLLEKAISRARELPEDRQDALAELILDVAENPPESLLTDAQWEEVRLALKEADEGKIATQAEVDTLWRRAGLSK